MGIRGEVFSSHISSGKRTYFFNVKENRNGDLFINLVESKKHGENGFERHSIVIFDEDMDAFFQEFSKAAEFMKNSRKKEVVIKRRKRRDDDDDRSFSRREGSRDDRGGFRRDDRGRGRDSRDRGGRDGHRGGQRDDRRDFKKREFRIKKSDQ